MARGIGSSRLPSPVRRRQARRMMRDRVSVRTRDCAPDLLCGYRIGAARIPIASVVPDGVRVRGSSGFKTFLG